MTLCHARLWNKLKRSTAPIDARPKHCARSKKDAT